MQDERKRVKPVLLLTNFILHPYFLGVCSWESGEPPELVDRVRILAPLLVLQS
jgi:hypothetical protein